MYFFYRWVPSIPVLALPCLALLGCHLLLSGMQWGDGLDDLAAVQADGNKQQTGWGGRSPLGLLLHVLTWHQR